MTLPRILDASVAKLSGWATPQAALPRTGSVLPRQGLIQARIVEQERPAEQADVLADGGGL